VTGFVGTLATYARPHRGPLIVGTAFLVVEALFGLILPYLGGRFVDAAFAGVEGGGWGVGVILVALAALFTVQFVLAVFGGYLSSKRATLIAADLRRRVFAHIQRLPLPYFQARQHGDVLAVLASDVALLSHYLSSSVVSIPPATVTAVGSIVLMALIDPTMAFAATVAIPLFYVLIKLVGRGLRPITVALQDAYARLYAFEEERVSLLPAIKSFSREPREDAAYAGLVERLTRLSLEQDWRQLAIGPGMVWAASMGMLAILWVLGERIVGGEMSKGAIVTFLLYTALLTRPISSMAGLYGQTQHARAAVDRINALMGTPTEDYGDGLPPLDVRQGSVRFEAVQFAYPGRPILFQRFDLDLRPGEVVAITGENGVGKSTLVSFLLRFNCPEQGRVLIDGQDIAGCRLSSVRAAVGYVSQQVQLLNGTVRDNVTFGRPDAAQDALEHAARLAQALDFIERLPAGWETVIGDDGIRLSGGQRQRIALARVLLLDPRIVILDEATAMYDPEAELAFLAAAVKVLAGRTVLLITHRPASLAIAHRVLRLEPSSAGDGVRPRVVEVTRNPSTPATADTPAPR
jgi:ABC-type multidrug transport system fused ATPase/permease subunit